MPRTPKFYTSLFAGLMVALAAGAVWSLVALMLRNDAPWMAIPLALVGAIAAGFVPVRHAWGRAAWAALLTLAGIAYAQFLHAANVISIALGTPLRDTLAAIGTEMAFALSVARVSRIGAIAIVAAPFLAAALAWHRARRG